MENPIPITSKKKYKGLKALLGTISLFLLLVIGMGIYVLTHTEEIKRFVLSQLNELLKTEIKVESIDVAFLKTFPFVALEFQNVWAWEVSDKQHSIQDTLLKAGRIYLEFDVLDVLHGKYQVKNIVIKEGGFYMKVFADGSNNYEFWAPLSGTVNAENLFNLSLRQINLLHTDFIYHNEITRQHYHFTIEKAKAKGDFASDIQKVKLRGNMFVHAMVSNHNKLFHKAPLSLSVDFTHDVLRRNVAIRDGKILYRNMDFLLNGNLSYGGRENDIRMDLRGKKLSLKSLITALPQDLQKKLSSMKASGSLQIHAMVSGNFSERKLPHIHLNFHLQNGKLYEKHSKQTLDNLEIQGYYSNGRLTNSETSVISLNKVGFQLNKGFFRGTIKVENFVAPQITMKVSTRLQLQELYPFLPFKNIESMHGNMFTDITLSGRVSDLKKRNRQSFQNIAFAGKMDIEDFTIKWKSFSQPLRQTTLKFVFDKHNIHIEQAKGYVGKTFFNMNGNLSDIFPFLFLSGQRMSLNGHLTLGDVVVEDWQKKEKNEEKQLGIYFPQNIALNITAKIANLSYKKMKGENISADLTVSSQEYVIRNLHLATLGGIIKGNVKIQQRKDQGALLAGDVKAENVRIEDVFSAFENFNQTTLTDKNLQGNVSSHVDFSIVMLPTGEFDTHSLKVAARSEIKDGRLKNIDLLQKLSLFVSEETLADVRFQTLTNDLTIVNRKITFGEMAIRSNVANFMVAGTHGFDKSINYALEISFSELVSQKKRERMKREQKEFSSYIEEEENRLKAFVKITGTSDNPIFQYDLKTNLHDIKQNLKEDKKTLLESIDKDLQLNLKENQKQKEAWRKQEQGEYLIEWDEILSADTVKEEKAPETNFTIEWSDE